MWSRRRSNAPDWGRVLRLAARLPTCIQHLPKRFAFVDVESDHAGLLACSDPTGNVGLTHSVNPERIEGRAKHGRAGVEKPVVINFAHQSAIKHLGSRIELIDSITA